MPDQDPNKDVTRAVRDRLASISGPVRLDVGCGRRKQGPDWLGIDQDPTSDADFKADVFSVLESFPENSVDELRAAHFLEHLEDVARFVAEMTRVLKPGGQACITVPHFSNALYYSDPTHKTAFGLYSFCYFSQSDLFLHQVPGYVRQPQLRLESVYLNFKASRPFYLRYALRKAVGFMVNLTGFFQEVYEDCFSGLVSCYEVRYILRKQS